MVDIQTFHSNGQEMTFLSKVAVLSELTVHKGICTLVFFFFFEAQDVLFCSVTGLG